MRVVTLRMDPSEKARLEMLARQKNVTLSWALREGARLMLEDAKHWLNEDSEEGQLVAIP